MAVLNKTETNSDEPMILKTLQARSAYTPDIDEIKYQKNIFVFVHDSLQSPYYNNLLFDEDDGSKFLGRAYLAKANFDLRCDAQGNPMLFHREFPNEVTPSTVEGEVYSVSASMLCYLDQWYENCHFTHRTKEFVTMMDQEPKLHAHNNTATLRVVERVFIWPSIERFPIQIFYPNTITTRVGKKGLRIRGWQFGYRGY